MSDLEGRNTGVSRRTVAKAMAWSVPAIAVAVPAPAYAASGDIINFTGGACKDPGNPKKYRFELEITNDTNSPLTITFDNLNVNGVDNDSALSPTVTVVPANTIRTLTIEGGLYPDSANGFAVLHYTAGGVTDQVSTNFDDNALPPIQNTNQCKILPLGVIEDVAIR